MALGQSQCLSDDYIDKMLEQLDSPQNATLNENLREELKGLKSQYAATYERLVKEGFNEEKLAKERARLNPIHETRLCEIFKQYGWLTKDLVDAEGVSAAFYLIKNSVSFQSQAALLPVIALAIKKNEIEKNEDFASFVDRLRLQAGLRQLFGTQARVSDGFLVLAPLQVESKVDQWRALYNMPPLAEYIKFLQNTYNVPLIKAPDLPVKTLASPLADSFHQNTSSNILETPILDDDVVRVDSSMVSLNVSVFRRDLTTYSGLLGKSDFRIYEDDRELRIAFFSQTETPFDLVLVLDLSGSTASKVGLLRRSVRRFIEAKRPIDRLSIVTFADEATIVSPLTEDESKLLESSKRIHGDGGSRVWDALKFTLDNVIDAKSSERRSAIVFMTDGADNALMYQPGFGSKTLYADLLEAVRDSQTTIVPVYLDTEGNDSSSRRVYRDARNTLALLAKESGGAVYTARKLTDLNGVYEQVLTDLSKAYSLGYIPGNDKRDGAWRSIKVLVPTRNDLVVRTKSGYYAK